MASLYDSASLVMIPSGYKDDKLYSIKPTDGSGDFTFSRDGAGASPATRVNASGLIEKGRENVILQSNQFDTTWGAGGTRVGGQSDKDGGTSAWSFTPIGATYALSQSLTTGGVQTFSLYVKKNATYGIRIYLFGSLNAATFFDLNNGAVVSSTSGTLDASIEAYNSDWWRVSVTCNSTLSQIALYTTNNGGSQVAGTITIQDAQLESGLVATDYIETTTAPVSAGLLGDMPRLDYSGGATCPSLLLEPSRTNSHIHSEYLADSYWLKYQCSITSNQAISPDGTNNASLFTSNASGDVVIYRSGVSYGAMSFFAKADNLSAGARFHIAVDTIGSANWNQDGTLHSQSGGLVSATDGEDYGNGWYRFTYVVGSGSVQNFGLSNSTSGDTFYIWGVQSEPSVTYPTSYIPTYGSAAGRAADACRGLFNGDNIFDTNWTAMVEMIVPSQGTDGTSAGFGVRNTEGSTTSTDWSFILTHRSGGLDLKTYDPQTSHNLTYTFGDTLKLLVRSDGHYFYNGTKYTLNALSSDEPVEVGFGRAGQADFSASENAEIKQTLVFDSALTDAECIALTTI